MEHLWKIKIDGSVHQYKKGVTIKAINVSVTFLNVMTYRMRKSSY